MKLLEKIIIEGVMPERALSRLQKAGICVFHAKKRKKNQILLSVSPKDSKKVFAIYPNVCYNVSVYSPYKAYPAGANGALSLLRFAYKRLGLIAGAIILLAACFTADKFVFKINVVGSKVYHHDVLETLERYGVKPFSRYEGGMEDAIAAEILGLDGVSYCSVKKSGTAVNVEVRVNAFSEPTAQSGGLIAERSGKLRAIAVLRGTPLKAVGGEVQAGEELVGGYIVGADENGTRTPVTAMARVVIECEYLKTFETADEKEALAAAILEIDGENVEILRTECVLLQGCVNVSIAYTYTQTINF